MRHPNPLQTQHHAFAQMAIAATLTVITLSPRALGQPTPASPNPVAAQVNGPEDDPNLPVLPYAMPGAPIFWSPLSGTIPRIQFVKPSSNGMYLGFNEKGSWIRNNNTRKVYVWNLKDRTLTLAADTDAGVPLNLRNPSRDMQDLIAIATGRGSSGVTSTPMAGRTTPYIPPSVAGDGNAQQARAVASGATTNAGNPLGTSRQFKGSGATLRDGILSFTLDDTSGPGKSVSLKVMRPPNQAMNNPNAPKPEGIAGTWMGEDTKIPGVVYTIYVQGENGSVSGTAMTGMAAEAMKRIMNASR